MERRTRAGAPRLIDWFPVDEGGHERLGMRLFFSPLRERASQGADRSGRGRVADRPSTSSPSTSESLRRSSPRPVTRFGSGVRPGGLRFFSKGAQVAMNDSRFNALATFLFELGWCGYLLRVRATDLSEEGEEMRLAGDLQPTGAFNFLSPEEE